MKLGITLLLAYFGYSAAVYGPPEVQLMVVVGLVVVASLGASSLNKLEQGE
jgi:hypothetical protein